MKARVLGALAVVAVSGLVACTVPAVDDAQFSTLAQRASTRSPAASGSVDPSPIPSSGEPFEAVLSTILGSETLDQDVIDTAKQLESAEFQALDQNYEMCLRLPDPQSCQNTINLERNADAAQALKDAPTYVISDLETKSASLLDPFQYLEFDSWATQQVNAAASSVTVAEVAGTN